MEEITPISGGLIALAEQLSSLVGDTLGICRAIGEGFGLPPRTLRNLADKVQQAVSNANMLADKGQQNGYS